MNAQNKKSQIEYGDFQTPPALAAEVTSLLRRLGFAPDLIVEPTCGRGAFLAAAAREFPTADLFGLEINASYAGDAVRALAELVHERNAVVHTGDFFEFDWESLRKGHSRPLVIGNPPWVTNSVVSKLDGKNLPKKSNAVGASGIDAITGKSNFDISEAILLKSLQWLAGHGDLAVLCKTSVARKIILSASKTFDVSESSIFKIDAKKHFDVAVDACLFLLKLERGAGKTSCRVFDSLNASEPHQIYAERNGKLLSGVLDESVEELWHRDLNYTWRSGIKHDAAQVMELEVANDGLRNGIGDVVEIEQEYVYPLLKSSDIANNRLRPRFLLVVTQQTVGQQTSGIKHIAPETWSYLTKHQKKMDSRGSSIYRGKVPFSIFGVGPYTFAPWKIAISALYKRLVFSKVGPYKGKPVVFDDTIYFLPCESEEEATFLLDMLHSEPAQQFLNAMIHWSDKRPVTTDVLHRLSLERLAKLLGQTSRYSSFKLRDTNFDRDRSLFTSEQSSFSLS